MFDFPQNFRAFVQSRGRGRAKGAKYVLLVLRSELGKRRQEQEVQLLQNKLMVNFNK
jgi:hypothetical protein